MPPYYLRKKLFFGEDEEEYYITDKEERIICRMKYMSTEPDNAAYIVAACNAVPRMVELAVPENGLCGRRKKSFKTHIKLRSRKNDHHRRTRRTCCSIY